MDHYFQNTFLFISKYKKDLLPLLNQLEWAQTYQIDRLDTILTRLGMSANTLRDSQHHLVIEYDIYQHAITKEYILRIQTESINDTHSIDVERCRLYLGQYIKLHYLSESKSLAFYRNIDIGHAYLPMRFKVELYMDETYDINYFVTILSLQKFIVSQFPSIRLTIFDTYTSILGKVNEYIKSLNPSNWCHIANYECKSI